MFFLTFLFLFHFRIILFVIFLVYGGALANRHIPNTIVLKYYSIRELRKSRNFSRALILLDFGTRSTKNHTSPRGIFSSVHGIFYFIS